MNTIKTIAIDDEPLALQLLCNYIEQTKFLELVGNFDNPLDAIEFMRNSKVDLAISDIKMPDLTGIEFAKLLQNPPKIIFTTAFEKYASESYRINAIDYLLKPISYAEFIEAVQKVKKECDRDIPKDNTLYEQEWIYVKSDYKIRKICITDIIYIEGLKDYVKFFIESDSKPIVSLNTIKSLTDRLPTNLFMRIHRSYIVNLHKIEVVERSTVLLGKKRIPISDQYKVVFQKYISRFLM